MTAATTPLPSPLAADAVVSNDPGSRTLTVKLSEREIGYAKLTWREGIRALVRSPQTTPTVWASTPTADRVAFGLPGEDGSSLKFHFWPGNEAYRELVSRPGLTAVVTLDRSAATITSVKFRHRTAV